MNATLNWVAGYAAERNYTVENAAVEKAVANAAREAAGRARHAAMILAAPFIGLAFAIALPLVGLAMLAWMAVRALPKRAKDIALFAAAPFIGLAYILAFPVIGFGALAWAAVRAARTK